MGIGPARNIARSINSWCACLQIGVDDDAVVDREASLVCEFEAGPDANAGDNEVGIEILATCELYLSIFKG